MPKSKPKATTPKVFRLYEEDVSRLTRLKEAWECSEAAVVRRLLREAVRREKLPDAS